MQSEGIIKFHLNCGDLNRMKWNGFSFPGSACHRGITKPFDCSSFISVIPSRVMESSGPRWLFHLRDRQCGCTWVKV